MPMKDLGPQMARHALQHSLRWWLWNPSYKVPQLARKRWAQPPTPQGHRLAARTFSRGRGSPNLEE